MSPRTPTKGLSAAVAVSWLAALVTVSATASTASRWGTAEPEDLLLLGSFVLLVAAGEFLRVTLPGQRDAAPIGAAMGLALALLPEVGDEPVTISSSAVVTVVAVGTLVGVTPHAIAARAPRADVIGRRLLSVAVAAVLFRDVPFGGLTLREHALGWDDARWRTALLMLGVALAAASVDLLLAAAVRAGQDHGPLRRVLVDEVQASVGITAAIGATGVLVALAARPMGLLALPVFAVPLLITQFAFRRYSAVRGTYLQTIRSLSRLTEIGGYTETRHSRRVSQLATDMGRDLGLGERDLLSLEYAALLHDIGQLSLPEPIPGGATVVASPQDQRRIAELGAGIVRQTGVLDGVATIVERQAHPYRSPGQHGSAGAGAVPLGSRIIKVANAYDDLVGESRGLSRRSQALERIHLGLAFEYDPRVVAALSRVLARG